MGATRVTEGGPPMVKSGSSGFGVGSTIRNLVLVSCFLVFIAFWFSGVSYVNQLIGNTLFRLNSNFLIASKEIEFQLFWLILVSPTVVWILRQRQTSGCTQWFG
ncbi:hypothetical protein Adt_32677 [Abeliophyllum distichum]|uniref:Uncharacterized protein n=1 Tax=Abeliophyllum distichum TaxID=126358 RepID=A0ABD1QWV6_9LAMI